METVKRVTSSYLPADPSRTRAGLGWVAASMLLLAGCAQRPSATGEGVVTGRPPGTTQFQLDTKASQIWLFLGADGPMAKVGHTHVITTHGLEGSIWLHPQPDHSGCDWTCRSPHS